MDTATSIGAQLRLAREARGMTLSDVAAITKITRRHLEAMEGEVFEGLPAGLFRREYVRAFAAAVGLDGARLSRAYVARFEPFRPPPPPPPQWTPSALSIGGIALVLGLCGALLVVGRHVVRAPAADDGADAADAADAGDAPGVVEEVDLRLVPDGPAPDLVPAASDASTPPVVAVPLRLRIAAAAPSWIGAEADGRRVVYRTLQAGESVTIDADARIELRVGDPAAVVCELNGRPAPLPGEPGRPVTVRFRSDAAPVPDTGPRTGAL